MRRPRSVTLLAVVVFVLGLVQGLRAATLFQQRALLSGLDLSIPLPYAILTASGWCVALSAAGLSLWRLRRWAGWLTLAAVTGSQAQAWFDRWMFARSDYARLSAGFDAGVSAVVLALAWGVVLWKRRQFQPAEK
jgi:hypothetical protein